MRRLKLLLLAAALLLALVAPKSPFSLSRQPVTAPVRVAYGPAPGFDAIDPELIGRAREKIDMAAYVLSDRKVIEALSAAASRGVRIRLYLDPEQFRRVGGASGDEAQALAHQPNVSAKIKTANEDLMHLKAYAVDGHWLRSGSANFSWSGETRQDNDIIIIDSVEAAADFLARFDLLWARSTNQDADR